jgi:DNA-binding CsgD family transcriptional regulator
VLERFVVEGVAMQVLNDAGVPVGQPVDELSFDIACHAALFVTYLTTDGVFVAMSRGAENNRRRFNHIPNRLEGRALDDYHSRGYADERRGFMRRCVATARPLTYRMIVSGEQYVNHMLPLQRDGRLTGIVVVVHQLLEGPVPASIINACEYIEAEHNVWGPLAMLTLRESQVLVHLGEGRSVREIAILLHRSAETIVSHKRAIYKKLSCDSLVAAAIIARKAGFTMRDAERIERQRKAGKRLIVTNATCIEDVSGIIEVPRT